MKNDNNLQLAIAQVQTNVAGYKKLKLPEKITTDKDYKLASDAVKYLNDKVKYAEDIRTKYTKPLLDQKREIDSQFKRPVAPLEALMSKVKLMMMDYMKVKRQEQLAYEKKMMESNTDKDLIIVDDKVEAIKRGSVSSNYVKTAIKYRVRDPKLRDAVVIKPEALREYMNDNPLPDFIETYEEESIIIRSK